MLHPRPSLAISVNQITVADVWMWLPREAFRFWVLAIKSKSLAIGILDEETIWKWHTNYLLILPRSSNLDHFHGVHVGVRSALIFGAHPVSFVKRRDHLTKHLLDKSLSNRQKKGSILGCFSSLGWRTHLWFVRDYLNTPEIWNLRTFTNPLGPYGTDGIV